MPVPRGRRRGERKPTVDDAFKELYDRAVVSAGGPVDLYAPEQVTMLGAYMARPGTPVVRVQSERVPTAALMRLYCEADVALRPYVKRSLHAKVGYLLRRRGFPQAGAVSVKWEPGGKVGAGEARRVVQGALEGIVGSSSGDRE